MVFLIQFLSLLIRRNTNNFGILIFYPTIFINLQLSSFNFTVDSIKFSTEMIMSFVNKDSFIAQNKQTNREIPLHIHWDSDNRKTITILGGHRKTDTLLMGI